MNTNLLPDKKKDPFTTHSTIVQNALIFMQGNLAALSRETFPHFFYVFDPGKRYFGHFLF